MTRSRTLAANRKRLEARKELCGLIRALGGLPYPGTLTLEMVLALERSALLCGELRERGRQERGNNACAACPDTPDNSQGYCAKHGREVRDQLDALDPPFGIEVGHPDRRRATSPKGRKDGRR